MSLWDTSFESFWGSINEMKCQFKIKLHSTWYNCPINTNE